MALLGAHPLQEIASIRLLYANLLDGDAIEINEDATTPEHLGTKINGGLRICN